MKNRFCITVLSVFIVLFVSCKKEKESAEPITFSFFSIDLMEYMSFDDLVAKKITEKTGVTLDLQYNHSDYNEAFELMIANNEYPDLIFAKSQLNKLIEAGAVIPLDDYIEKFGPNIKSLYGNQLVKLKYTIDDPSIYCLGTYDIKNLVTETSGNIQVQHAVLKEFGYPRIRTLDDLENALLTYKALYPEINGHKTLGLSLLCDSWFWYLGLSNPGGYVIGRQDDGQWFVNQDTLEAEYKFLNPEMKIFYKWLNKIYQEDLLDPESFTQSEEVWKNKCRGGYVLATSFPLWGLKDIKTKLSSYDMEDRTFAYLPVTAGENYLDPSLKDYGFSGGWGIAISKNCKDVEKAVKFLDYICSEECQKMLNWGIEGITYSVDEKGKMHMFKNLPSNNGIGNWVYPFPEAGRGAFDKYGNSIMNISLDKIMGEYTSAEKETLSAYGVEKWTDLFPSSEELGVSKYGQIWQYSLNSEMNEILTKTDDFVKESLIKMITGPEMLFDEAWENMVNELKKSRIIEVQDYLNVLISQTMELWEIN